MVESSATDSISVKMVVHLSTEQPPINFTCDISSRVDHVISHVVCELGVASQLKPEDSKSEAWRKVRHALFASLQRCAQTIAETCRG